MLIPPSRQLTLSCSQNAVPNYPFADCLHLLHSDLSRKLKKTFTEHEAVMVLSSPNLLLVKPIAKDLPQVPSTNKEAHKLKFGPPPTIEHKAVVYALKRSNGQVTMPP